MMSTGRETTNKDFHDIDELLPSGAMNWEAIATHKIRENEDEQ